jgi:hypothetical protein
MAAVVQAQISIGAGPTVTSAESGTNTFGRDDIQQSVVGTPKPAAAGTAYSWYKTFSLMVTSGGGASNILNRTVRHTVSPVAMPTGGELHFKDGGASYVQATSGNKPTDNGTTDLADVATWTGMTTTAQAWHAASAAAVNSTRNGNYVLIMLGISSTWASGGGEVGLPQIELGYDES